MKNNQKRHLLSSPYGQKGFSLIEIIIVVLIGGIITSVFFNLISTTLKNIRLQENERKFEFINNELNRFVETRGRFPCPASLTAPAETVNFGNEILTNCNDSTLVAGTFRTTGTAGRRIRIGALPTRTLNLPDDHIFDAHNNRFIYAVTENMAEQTTFVPDQGGISIVDRNGNSIVTPDGTAPFVIISLGENKGGAYNGAGGVLSGLDCTTLSALEQENCDNDDTFVSSLFISDDPANYYDDQVHSYSTSTRFNSVPAGGVMFFNLTACPEGWQAFAATPPPGTVSCVKI